MAWTRTDQDRPGRAAVQMQRGGSFGVYVDDRSRKVYWQLRHNSLRGKKRNPECFQGFYPKLYVKDDAVEKQDQENCGYNRF